MARNGRCPHCGGPVKIAPDAAPTRRIHCPSCRKRFAVREAERSAAPPGKAAGTKPRRRRPAPLFSVGEKIGTGALSTVYEAVDPREGRAVAFKVLDEHLARDRHCVRRFLEHSEVMAGLEHPNIVAVYERGERGAMVFYAMERVDGPPLRTVLRKAKKGLEPARAVTLVRQIAQGLDYAHQRGVVHGDLQPGNVLLTKSDVPKIADLGLAVAMNRSRSHHAAPEVEAGAAPTARSDIFSLGALFYEMLTGTLPFGRYKRPSQIHRKLPKQLDTIVGRAITPDPAQRYPSVTAFLRDLSRPALLKAVREIAPPAPKASGRRPGPAISRFDRLVAALRTAKPWKLDRRQAKILLGAAAAALFVLWLANTGDVPDRRTDAQPEGKSAERSKTPRRATRAAVLAAQARAERSWHDLLDFPLDDRTFRELHTIDSTMQRGRVWLEEGEYGKALAAYEEAEQKCQTLKQSER